MSQNKKMTIPLSPNEGGQALHVLRIGVRVPRWATQNQQLLNGIIRFVREYRRTWKIDADVFFDNELPLNTIDEDWEGDGLIVFRCSEEEVAAWKAKGTPVVNISSETQIDGVPNVLVDNFQMGTLAAEYLIGLGLHHFAFVGEQTRNYSAQRYAGYLATLEKRGFHCRQIDLPISKMRVSTKAKTIHNRLNQALADLPFPIGVLARDDLLAMNVLRSTQFLGISVPDEISLIGINDQSPYCQVSFPRLTSVKHPGELIGYCAAEMLNQMIHGKDIKQDSVFQSSGIVERESTNPVAMQDELVANTLKYIRQHAKNKAINVEEICRKLGVSNTILRIRFKKSMGCSIKVEVDRVRMQEIRYLLLETHLSVQEIAFQLGFSRPEDLSRFFTRIEGVSPQKYRVLQAKGGQ